MALPHETQFRCQKMSKKKDIESIPRTQAETEQIGRDCLAYLQHLCEDYDKGNTFAVVLIAVVLRTLLKTKGSTISALALKKKRDDRTSERLYNDETIINYISKIRKNSLLMAFGKS